MNKPNHPVVKHGIFPGLLLWLLPLIFLVVFFFTPMVNIFTVMFTRKGEINLGLILRPLWFTVWQAGLSTLLTLAVGLPAAFVFARFSFKGKRLLRLLTTLPFILPTVVVAAAFTAFLGPRGLVNEGLMNLLELDVPPISFMNTLSAILVAHVFYNTSVVIRVVGSTLAQLDPRVEYAGQVLGASPTRVFREITLPLIRPSILAAALMVFLFDFSSFGVVLLLGGPKFSTLEVAIYTQTLSMFNLPMAGLLSILQLVCTFGVMQLHAKVNGSRTVPLMPRLRGEGTKTPRHFFEKLLLWFVILVLVLLLVLPLAALVIRSITQANEVAGGMNVTLDFYRELFINRRNSFFYVPPVAAAFNSLVYAFETVILSVGMGVLVSYLLVRNQIAAKWIDPLIMLPLGASAVTLGLGFLITFDRLMTFPLLIPIAHSLVALPFVVRTVQPVLAAIPGSLRESAAVLGASPWRVWWQVEAHIIGKAAGVASIFAFTISLGEFGATTFLARPENPTLPVAIYRFLSQPGAMNYGQAMAMSTFLMLVCAAAVGFLDLLQQNRKSEI